MVCTALSGDDTKGAVVMEDDMVIRPVKPFGQITRLVDYICR